MPGKALNLIAVAEAIADGRAVDWTAVESSVDDQADRELVQQLKLLADIAHASRDAGQTASAATTREPTAPLHRWGPLELRECVGSGSFGTVYRAWDPRLHREVALKLLHEHRTAADAAVTVLNEGRLLARVRHSHVITVHGADCFDGRVGIWMEYVRGRTLENVLAEGGPLGASEAALIGMDLCSALAAVHGAGLIHRDVKAQNVLREHGGRIVLMDFGAGTESAGSALASPAGTPVYMAPELFNGAPPSVRSDIYALGVLLYRLVTGRYPVTGETFTAVEAHHAAASRQHLRDLRADLPASFVALVERALAVDPAERFATAGEMEAALGRVVRPEPKGRPFPRSWAAAAAPIRRHPGFAAALFGLMLTVAVALTPIRQMVVNWIRPAGAISVAVLPFDDLSGDPAQAYVARGVRDILVARLATIRALRLVAPQGQPRPETGPRNYAAIGKALGADTLMEGSVQRDGPRLRVTTRLLQAGTGTLIWSETFERPLQDLFTLQGEIATAIARHVRADLSGPEQAQLATRYSTSAEAQDAYLQGRYLFYRFNRPAAVQARAYLERAVTLDPSYGVAHASLARLYLLLQEYRELSPADAHPLAVAEAARAAELAPGIAEARVALAEVRFKVLHDYAGAEQEYRAALQLSPGSSLVRSPYARFLSSSGRTRDALEQAMSGFQSDPLSSEMAASVAVTHYYLRDFDGAVEWYQRSLDLESRYAPGYFGRGRAQSWRGHHEEAVKDLQYAIELSGRDPSYVAELGRVYAAGGWRNAAEQVLGSLLQLGQPGVAVAPQDLAYVYAALGDRERALTLLKDALAQNDSRLLFLKVDPRVDSLRDDPRFDDILTTLGLAR